MTARIAATAMRAASAHRLLWWTCPVVLAPVAVRFAQAPTWALALRGWLALVWGAWHRHALTWRVDTQGWRTWRWHPATGSSARFVWLGALMHSALIAGLFRVPWRDVAPSGAGRALALCGAVSASTLVVHRVAQWSRLARRGLTERATHAGRWLRLRLRRVS